MDGNKDEALRCVRIAEDAIATGNKIRALKFIRIAQRLNNNLNIDALLSKCERLDSQSSASSSSSSSSMNGSTTKNSVVDDEGLNGNRNYTDENLRLIREIKLKSDYYAILSVDKSCSVEEIRKAYRKLSLKVHPDKNKAPGSEEAFKKVSKAFKCLSDDDSRRQYDQTGLVDEFEYNQQYNVPRRRRRTAGAMSRDFFDEDFDPNEIFRAFFGQSDVFGRAHVYRTRGAGHHHRPEFRGGGSSGGGGGNGGLSLMLLLQLLPFLIIMLVAYLPFSEPEYSLHKNYSYQVPKTTDNYGVQFFVKSEAFDHKYPQGSPARATIEDNVIKDYRSMLRRYCQIEVQRRSWNRNLPTPHCDRLQSFGVEA